MSIWPRPRLCVSFSGGKTSGYMTRHLLTMNTRDDLYTRDQYEMVVVFANTSREREETLQFVDMCDRFWGFNTVWVEAVVHHGEEVASTHRIVDFTNAKRKGEVFEEVIKKYGIPNQAYPHCTRELKLNPIKSYLHSIGWEEGSYFRAIGIRADEPRRLPEVPAAGHLYPLASSAWLGMVTKPLINDWWEEQPFNLNLEEHEGNCENCWKKSDAKLVRIAQERPVAFDWTAEMEARYGLAGHNVDGTPRTFFRQHRSTQDILALAEMSTPPPALQPDLDWGCTESCEPFGEQP